MPDQALAGITVLDLTHHISGPYCTKLLADFGAEVIKIEPPGRGDPTRRLGPFFHDEVHLEKSGLFWHLNGNKQSVTLDLKSATGKKLFFELLEQVDVLVESFSPRVMPSLGLDYATLRERKPSLIMTSVSNFGQSGPYRDYKSSEIITYAMGGPMHATGLPEREPMKLGENVLQFHVGGVAAAATNMAVWNMETTGQGDHVDVSLFRAQASNQDRRTTMLIGYQYTNHVNERRAAGGSTAVGVRPCSDGYVNLMGSTERFPRLVNMMGQPELLDDPRFESPLARAQPTASEEFDMYYIPWLLGHTKRDLFQMAQEYRIPSGPIYDSSDLLSDPNIRQRGVWQEVDHPGAGSVTHPGRPFIMNETPWRFKNPAPTLGQHNEDVLCGRLGYARRDLVRLRRLGVI